VNTTEPHRSLLTPLFNYDIERAVRERKLTRGSIRGSIKLPSVVQITSDAAINEGDAGSKKSKSTGSRRGSTSMPPSQ